MGERWAKFKDEWKEGMEKEREKERIKQEKKREREANMSEGDKAAKEAWGTAKVYMAVRYFPHMVIALVFAFMIGWFILDSIWNWFIGLF